MPPQSNYRYIFSFLLAILLVVVTIGALPHRAWAQESPQNLTSIAPQSGLSTPDLLDRALARGEITADDRLRYLSYALFEPDRLPEPFRSGAPWSATQYMRELRNAPHVQGAAVQAGFCNRTTRFTASARSEHFFLEYNTIAGGLNIQDYMRALEAAYDRFVNQYQWQTPPFETGKDRYHVLIDDLGQGPLAYVLNWEEFPRNDGTRYWASCMVLRHDYASSSGSLTADQLLRATVGHEFHHVLQDGYGYGQTAPQRMWVESTAAWAEDEVAPDVHDNYDYLWPAFGSCLKNYAHPTRGAVDQYTNWLFFRYLVEHNGGANTVGGGEEVMQIYYEGIARGEASLDALNNALAASGTTLDQAYHDYAIASRFMLSCPIDAPHCFDQGQEYAAIGRAIGDNGRINAVGADYLGSIEDNFAMSWVQLPRREKAYNITLENRSNSGELRASIVALTNEGLTITPMPEFVGNNRSVTLRDYQPPEDAFHITAVVTNHAVTNGNSCSVNLYKLSVDAPSTPPPPEPAACAIDPSLVRAAGAQAAAPPLDVSVYGLAVISGTQNAGITFIEPFVSINELGTVAFAAQQEQDHSGLFAATGADGVKEVASAARQVRRFSPAVQINDANQIIAHDQQPGSPSQLTKIRLWDALATESWTQIASGQFTNVGSEFDAVFAYPSVNNDGAAAFGALTEHDPPNPDNPECTERCLVKSGTEFFHTEAAPAPPRPMIADNGRVVLKHGELPDDPIRIYDDTLANFHEVANTEVGFTDMGRHPGISDDGKIAAFYAVLNQSGAEQLNTTSGPGIFAAVEINRQWHIRRVAGVAGNGQLDPGETWNDANNNDVLDTGEDEGPYTAFRPDERIGIASDLTRPLCGSVIVTYLAEKTAGAGLGLYAMPLQVNLEEVRISLVNDVTTVIETGDDLPANHGTVQNLAIHDPINDRGQVAFWAETSAGTQVVVRSEPTRRPVLVVPGVVGSLGKDLDTWLGTRVTTPPEHEIDPILQAYDDIIQTLKNAGYCSGADCEYENLFVATYDWRLPAGPIDGTFDGTISGLSAARITDATYENGVDYLGYWLRRAAEAWDQRYPGVPLDGVDLVTHSNGGIVSRIYIQSDAYGGAFTGAGGEQLELPKVQNFIMIGTPNRGASKSWNAMQDNYVVDAASRIVLSKMLKIPYKWVAADGETIFGPGGSTISQETIRGPDGKLSPALFAAQYVPTVRYLGATYPFLDQGNGLETVNQQADKRNDLLLDLNAGLDSAQPGGDPNAFADKVEGHVLVIYGNGVKTPTAVTKKTGPDTFKLSPFTDWILSLDETLGHFPAANEVWYLDEETDEGDGTVPVISARGQFVDDSRIELLELRGGHGGNTADSVEHVPLVANHDTQKAVLRTLNIDPDRVQLSTGLLNGSVGGAWEARRVIATGMLRLDPVEAFLIDGEGRRLGYSRATGPVTEIPDSAWVGETGGIGWFFSDLQPPYTLELTGLGEPYDVAVYLEQPGRDMGLTFGGAEQQGFLAAGETVTFDVPTFITVETNIVDPREPPAETPTSTPTTTPDTPDPATPTPTATGPASGGAAHALYLPLIYGGTRNAGPTPTPTPTPTSSATPPGGPTPTPTATAPTAGSPTPGATTPSSGAPTALPPTPSVTPPPIGAGISTAATDRFGLGALNALDFAPDGQHVVVGGEGGSGAIIELNSGAVLHQLAGHSEKVNGVAYSPDGQHVATGSQDGTIRLWETATGRLVRTLSRTDFGYRDYVTSVAFSPDGAQILAGVHGGYGGVPDPYVALLWDVVSGELLRIFQGHTSGVLAVAFSPDGAQIATGGWDQSVKLWNASSGALIRTFSGHGGRIPSVDFSPDGARIVASDISGKARIWNVSSGAFLELNHGGSLYAADFAPDGARVLTVSSNQTARVWDAGTGELVQEITGHSDEVRAGQFAPDGSQILTGGKDGSLRVWDATPPTMQTFDAHTGALWALTISPDGTRLLSGGADSVAHLWDASDHTIIRSFVGHSQAVIAVAFSPDGTRALTGSQDRTARLWDVATGAEIRQFTDHTGYVSAVAFAPDGGQVMTASWDRTAKLWNAETGAEVQTFSGHTAQIGDAAYNGMHVVTASGDRTVRLWDAATGGQIRVLADGPWANAVAFSPNGAQIVYGGTDRTVHVQNIADGATQILDAGVEVKAVAFAPDGAQVAAGTSSGLVQQWDVATGALYNTHRDSTTTPPVAFNAAAFSSDGEWLYAGSESGVLLRWPAAAGAVESVMYDGGHSDAVEALALSPDGAQMLTGSWDSSLLLWDTATQKPLARLDGHPRQVFSAAFAPDGVTAATGGGMGQIHIWDLAQRRIRRTLKLPSSNDYALDLAFAPDGARLAVGSSNRTATIWNVNTGELLHTLTGHNAWVNAVAFSPDGSQLISGSGDNSVLRWDANSGANVGSLGGHTDEVTAVTFSPDGSHILSAGLDGTARLYDAVNGVEVRTLAYRLPTTGGERAVPLRSAAFGPEGDVVLLGDNERKAHLWDVSSGALLRVFTGHEAAVLNVAFAPDGQTVITAGGRGDNAVRFWDAATRSPIRTLRGHTGEVLATVFMPDGQQIITTACDQTARLWDAASGTELHTFTGHNHSITPCVDLAAVSPDGQYALTGNGSGVRLWNLTTLEFVRNIVGHNFATRSVAFSPDGSRILTGGQDRPPQSCLSDCASAKLWDRETGELLQTFLHLLDVSSAVFSPDGGLVLTGSTDGAVRLWSAATGELLRTYTGHTRAVYAVAFAPDGAQILSGGADGVVLLRDWATGAVLHTYAHSDAVWAVAFSPDGAHVITSSDTSAYLWNATGGGLETVVSHTEAVRSARVSPNGSQLLTGSWDGTARLWNASAE